MKPLFTLALVALPAFAAFSNGYTYCKVVTTSHTMVSGSSDLTNYPLAVILTDADLKVTGSGGRVQNSNGYDIVFDDSTTCSGAGTALTWDLDNYVPTTGAIVVHLLRPTLSHTANDVISMYYGKASVSTYQSTRASAWNSNYKGVWHLNSDPAGSAPQETDTKGLADGSSITGGAAWTSGQSVAGKLGNALNFIKTANQGIDMGIYNPVAVPGDFTISIWMYVTAWPSDAGFGIIRGADWLPDTGAISSYGLAIASTGVVYLLLHDNSGTDHGFFSSGTLSTDAWHYVVGVFRNGGTSSIYIDGAEDGNASTTCDFYSNYFSHFRIGTTYRGSPYQYSFDGYLDEGRVSNAAHTADWVLTEYRNQSAPGTYISAGSTLTGDGTRVRHGVRGGG
jgi:Concanavalin A-like lectin/glucanases superfamily